MYCATADRTSGVVLFEKIVCRGCESYAAQSDRGYERNWRIRHPTPKSTQTPRQGSDTAVCDLGSRIPTKLPAQYLQNCEFLGRSAETVDVMIAESSANSDSDTTSQGEVVVRRGRDLSELDAAQFVLNDYLPPSCSPRAGEESPRPRLRRSPVTAV
ncbi:hypothetical protein C8T65DRAFT_699277 [Cerioporus squamosus]|nr:hypothetical protein C8T65DRAFT_699277 [Cerioporus squamosus]